MKYPKRKPLRLKGKKLYDLYDRVFDRDNYLCVECGSNQLDRAPHHKIFKSQGGEDTEENLVTLCVKCHGLAHGINIV